MSEIQEPDLTWWNVIFASSAIFFIAFVSRMLGLKLGSSLIIAAARCIIQLTIMGLVLDDVLRTENEAAVITMSIMMVLLGTYEAVFNRARKTLKGMFPIIFGILITSNLCVACICTSIVLKADPFWEPSVFIPVMGMLLGNSIGSVAMSIERCLDQFSTHYSILETRLSYGASRYEAALPLAVETIRLTSLPIVTQLSVMGMINIPGMMTGQIMAGAPMFQAVMYQQCIMFMVTASSTFGVILSVIVCLSVLIDENQMIRMDRIRNTKGLRRHPVTLGLLRTLKASVVCLGYKLRLKRRKRKITIND